MQIDDGILRILAMEKKVQGGVEHIFLARQVFIWLARETVIDSIHAFRGFLGETKAMVETRQKIVVGARHRDPENSGKTNKNHTYNIVQSYLRSCCCRRCVRPGCQPRGDDYVWSGSRNVVRPPPRSYTVNTVLGHTVEGNLVMYQARHPYEDVHALAVFGSIERPAP